MQVYALHAGNLKEAFSHCVNLRESEVLLHSMGWQQSSLDIAEVYLDYIHVYIQAHCVRQLICLKFWKTIFTY